MVFKIKMKKGIISKNCIKLLLRIKSSGKDLQCRCLPTKQPFGHTICPNNGVGQCINPFELDSYPRKEWVS